MAQPYVGEIRMFAGNFAPAGWFFCEGQLIPISENETLFQLIGTTYGGDGQSTFALPDLRGRLPLHMGTGGGGTYILAETGGTEEVTLTVNQIPSHTHAMACSSGGGTIASDPSNGVAAPADISQYNKTLPANTQMGTPATTSDPVGGSQPHTNFMPYLCINFIISQFGIFPSPT
jgi:microcystin-dependent protein